MKTIQDLNNKIWYRLIKTFYLFFMLAVFIIGSIVIYDDSYYYAFNSDKTLIYCSQSGAKFDVNKNDYDIGIFMTEEQKTKIAQDLCQIKYPFANALNNESIFSKYSLNDEFITWNQIFSATKGIEEKKFHFIKFPFKIIGFSLILVIISEILRRTFYYVVLGKINPKK
jgi:hypothetical protein